MYMESAFRWYFSGLAAILFRKRRSAEAFWRLESRIRAERFTWSPFYGNVFRGLECQSILGTLFTCVNVVQRFLTYSVQWRNSYSIGEAAARRCNGLDIYCCGICAKRLHTAQKSASESLAPSVQLQIVDLIRHQGLMNLPLYIFLNLMSDSMYSRSSSTTTSNLRWSFLVSSPYSNLRTYGLILTHLSI